MFTHNTSLIIPTKDRPLELLKLLKQLKLFNIKFFEILVVDSSNFKNKELVNSICKKLLIKLYTTWPSTSHQRNLGLDKKNKSSEYTMFLDDDVIFFKNSFFEMNKTIVKYKKNRSISGFIFNQYIKNKNQKLIEKFKSSKLIEILNLYSYKPGKIMNSGWHTKILNVKNDLYADWAYTTASIYKSKDIHNFRFDESFGKYSYLEDLDFSLNLKKKNKKFIISHLAKFTHPLNIDRSDFDFGVTELFNRYKIVVKHNLNKKLFFIASFLKFIIFFLSILKGNKKYFLRSLGNIKGVYKIIIKFK